MLVIFCEKRLLIIANKYAGCITRKIFPRASSWSAQKWRREDESPQSNPNSHVEPHLLAAQSSRQMAAGEGVLRELQRSRKNMNFLPSADDWNFWVLLKKNQNLPVAVFNFFYTSCLVVDCSVFGFLTLVSYRSIFFIASWRAIEK